MGPWWIMYRPVCASRHVLTLSSQSTGFDFSHFGSGRGIGHFSSLSERTSLVEIDPHSSLFFKPSLSRVDSCTPQLLFRCDSLKEKESLRRILIRVVLSKMSRLEYFGRYYDLPSEFPSYATADEILLVLFKP